MKGRHTKYSPDELAWIKAHRKLPRRQAHSMFCRKFDRADVSLANFQALCKRKDWLTGRTGCFEKGSIPANKGMKMPYNPNSARTRFRKGHSPHNTKYLGHERVNKDGYIEISIDEVNPRTGFERQYVLKHRWLWEKRNGPLPQDMCLKCLDGNKLNTDPSNWEAIPRAMLPRLNGCYGRNYDNAPAELKPVIMTTARLAHEAYIRKANKTSRSGKREASS